MLGLQVYIQPRLLDFLLDLVPCMLAILGRDPLLFSPDSDGISMLEAPLFIAAALAMPLVAKSINKVSRKRSIFFGRSVGRQ